MTQPSDSAGGSPEESPSDVASVVEAYLAARREPDTGRAWVLLNMIASIDGAISIDGLSGGLGGDADRAVFRALRSVADVILVAAGTVRAEGYGVPATDAATQRQRLSRGQSPRPVVAVVTRSLSLDADTPLFADPDYRPCVVTVTDAPVERVAALERVAHIIQVGHGDVDLAPALGELARRWGPVVLAEGGPTLNGQLAAADLLDEVCVTVSPVLVGGTAGRMLAGEHAHDPRSFVVDRALAAGGLLFTRHLRDRT